MFRLSEIYGLETVGGGSRMPDSQPAEELTAPFDVAAMFYVSNGQIVRVMFEEGLTGRPA